MATAHKNQSGFIWLFLAVRRADLLSKPHRESVIAPDEITARKQLAGRFVLSFAGRIPCKAVHHG